MMPSPPAIINLSSRPRKRSDIPLNTSIQIDRLTMQWDVDPADHCETPYIAYSHIRPILKRLAQRLRKDPAELAIWDPYFCLGTVKKHLARLGFMNVTNRKVDFYRTIVEGQAPAYDVLVTNPPFGRDHIERLMDFVLASDKAWFLLMPSYVHRKAYWKALVRAKCNFVPALLSPRIPYTFKPLLGGRDANVNVCRHWAREQRCQFLEQGKCRFLHPSDKSGCRPHILNQSTALKSQSHSLGLAGRSPFDCCWFLGLGSKWHMPILNWWKCSSRGKKSKSSLHFLQQ